LDEIIGSGSYGTVRKCRNKETGQIFACKTIAKENVDNIQMLQREIAIMKEVRHPHIIQLEDVYEDEDHIHLVTELCTGGELYDRVIDKAEAADGNGHFSELDAAHIIHDILDAISYCHDEKHIVHRDLKPENFLLKDKSDQSAVKIIDFGLSRRDDDSPFGIMRSRVGT
jgi:calcium-dependent protein kinase